MLKKIGKLCFQIASKKTKFFTSAIILAAGKSERMKEIGVPKQMIELNGIPVVVHSLLAFEKSENIHEILVVAGAAELPLYREFKKKYNITKLSLAVEGGSTRAESASHGFQKISNKAEFVLIHDAARCLISTEDIDRIVKEAYRTGAAIAAKKTTDTLKRADENGYIAETVDRALMWQAQTPQVFKKSIYEVALAMEKSKDAGITDDAMLVEQAGFRVKLVACESENMKITTKQDLAIAKILIEKKTEEAPS